MTQAGGNPKDSSLGLLAVIYPPILRSSGVFRPRFFIDLDSEGGSFMGRKEVIRSSQSVIYRGDLYRFFYRKT